MSTTAMTKKYVTIDGNEAVAYVAHQLNEVIAIYPITPSSTMGEWSDQWSAEGRKNLFGTVPLVIEMQSEGGAAGAVHGALQTGALTTTFTSSQGLLLMLPNMYKIAGELTPMVMHVAARSLAAQALSIFGDHSDVMAARMTGFCLLSSCSVQEAMDFALISQAATLKARLPFIHFFDGFRTSHEVSKIEFLSQDVMRKLIKDELIIAHRQRALSPDHPVLRGSAQNPDVYFQARETVNPFYLACPTIVQETMDEFAKETGRQYRLFDYYGPQDAERVIVLMGSGAETTKETIDHLQKQGEKVGLVTVHLFHPFHIPSFMQVIPATTKALAILDRTKEPGSLGEPLYQACLNALHEGLEQNSTGQYPLQHLPKIIGGRYGLSSKEFTPAMIKGIYDELKKTTPKNHFTIGINDDVTHTSLEYREDFSCEADEVFRALFFGLGSDGTVGANKNSIKIIGEDTENFAQGYFVYDSKKAGAITVSHLRFGPKPIRSAYLISQANFVACHQASFLERLDMLSSIMEGGTFLLNSPHGHEQVFASLPREVQKQIIDKRLKFYCIDADTVASESGMGRRINTIMQVCFFAISGVLPRDMAIKEIKKSIQKTYGAKGAAIVEMNFKAVDKTLANLQEVVYPQELTSDLHMLPPVPPEAPEFVRKVTGEIIAGHGDALPVSMLPVDGTYPTDTARWEKRNIALEIPVWDSSLCIQCGKCSSVCPHAAVRIKAYDAKYLAGAPATFKSVPAKDKEWQGLRYTVQVAPEDCTGCTLCTDVCPGKSKTDPTQKSLMMHPQRPLRATEKENWDFFLDIGEIARETLKTTTLRQQQVQEPLFAFSSACGGCGETPYLKLVTQLFGERMLVANATGCSSIYGGNLPTTPWGKSKTGRGPAWSNSLFEDNAEFGLGYRCTLDKHLELASELVKKLANDIPDLTPDFVTSLVGAKQKSDQEITEQRARVKYLTETLEKFLQQEGATLKTTAPQKLSDIKQLLSLAENFVKKSVWIIGGDGWAYDIGFGGLDHVLASGRNVNILVLDTEVYSNTGGQMSKSTPKGATARFAASGKPTAKKDLGLMAMSYGSVYVASVCLGARDDQTLKAFIEAESYDGPSLIIAYSPCIAHGINMSEALDHSKAAVDSGQWLLYRYHPERALAGENPLQLDSKKPKIPIEDYLKRQTRFNVLTVKNKADNNLALEKANPFSSIQKDIEDRFALYEHLATRKLPAPVNG